MFRLTVARSTAEIDRLSSAWDSLFSSDLTIFQTYRWNRLAAHCFADREEPYFVLAETDSGAAILPAVVQIQTKTISFAGEQLFDYRDYLARGDQEPLRRAWKYLASLGLPLDVTAICHPEHRIWNLLPKSFFSRAPRLNAATISAEQFTRDHSRAFSRLRKLERMGLRISEYAGDCPIAARIYTRRAEQCVEGELFHDRRRVEFMVAACAQERKKCEVFVLEHGSSTIAAALITFRDGNFRRFYTTYYDRLWARYSPGVSLLFEIARRCLEQGLSFDLMTGEQGYKKRIAQDAQDLFCVKATAAELRAAFPTSSAAEQAA